MNPQSQELVYPPLEAVTSSKNFQELWIWSSRDPGAVCRPLTLKLAASAQMFDVKGSLDVFPQHLYRVKIWASTEQSKRWIFFFLSHSVVDLLPSLGFLFYCITHLLLRFSWWTATLKNRDICQFQGCLQAFRCYPGVPPPCLCLLAPPSLVQLLLIVYRSSWDWTGV